MTKEHDDFVNIMLEKSKKKEVTEPQNRIGSSSNVDPKEVAAKLKEIQERLQQK